MIRAAGLFFLLLLKILGWTVLFLLAFLLLLFLLILFVPIHYQVQVQNERNLQGHNPVKNLRLQVQIHWLLHLLKISASYGPQGFKSQILAAGIDIPKKFAWLKKKKEARQDRRQAKKNVQTAAESQVQADEQAMEIVPEPLQDSKEMRQQASGSESAADKTDLSESVFEPVSKETAPPVQEQLQTFEEHTPSGQSPAKKERKNKKKPKKKKHRKNRKQAGQSKAEPGFFTRLRSQYDKIRKEIKDETNRYAVGRIWTELLKVIRSYRPKKLRADISFSLADPALTGQAVGLISLLPWIYRYPCSIFPDFTSEQLYLEGEIFAQGKIRVYVFVLTTLRLLRDKKFMQVVRRLLGRDQ